MDLKTIPTKELLLELMTRAKVEAKHLRSQEGYAISTDKELLVLSIPEDAYETEERSNN